MLSRYQAALLATSIALDTAALGCGPFWVMDYPAVERLFPFLAFVAVLLNLYWVNDKMTRLYLIR